MSESTYKDTQIFKPNGTNIYDDHLGEVYKLKDNISAEELFHSKNIYRDVKSNVIPGPVKTTTIEKVTKIPKIIFKERPLDTKKEKKEKKVITKEVEIENVVEVIENKEKVVYNEVKVPKYVDVPIIQPRQEVCYQQISKNIPRGVELVITQTLEVPKIKPKYVEIPVPIYVPCYIEVPIPAQYIPTEQNEEKDYFASGISNSSKFSKRANFYNSSLAHSQNFNTPITLNQNLNINDEKSLDFSSKCSIPNISSEQKNVEKMVIAGNL
ncbi:conserved Plasmodium protein, unknown function [Plasmodium gallinaceum]|uniref:PhIL1 interacting protein PIP3 n=1 Tax=Plasmodium gallinaceum TaxID=5849 RepID=A0A1J1GTH2_PLAGA|nr:conserved Plasmodium protein, unknown function [Plasmodium gallinaceum]CRG95812.1 conserved Plasmodium protein, unknown function [Plasmodium gallinaceum]